MNYKTPAELQMELLRKLKQQQSSSPPRPPAAAQQDSTPSTLAERRKSPKKRSKTPALPVSRAQWERLRDRFTSGGTFRPGLAWGDFAAEFLLTLPDDPAKMETTLKRELLVLIKNWCDSRYNK